MFPPGHVTLVGGSGAHEGNVYMDGLPVCDSNWDAKDGEIVCNQLYFAKLGEIKTGSHFGVSTAGFVMGNTKCVGNERELIDCPHEKAELCGPNNVAGVVCREGT